MEDLTEGERRLAVAAAAQRLERAMIEHTRLSQTDAAAASSAAAPNWTARPTSVSNWTGGDSSASHGGAEATLPRVRHLFPFHLLTEAELLELVGSNPDPADTGPRSISIGRDIATRGDDSCFMAVILTGVAGVYMNRDDEFSGGSSGDGNGGDGSILLDGGVDVNPSVDGGRQLSITRPFRGGGGGGGGGGSGSNDLSLDNGHQLSITHPTSGGGVLSLDGGRQLNPTQPIKSGRGGMPRGPLALVGELRAGDTVSVLSLLTGSPVPTTIRALTEDVQVLTPNLKCLVLMYNYILNLNVK